MHHLFYFSPDRKVTAFFADRNSACGKYHDGRKDGSYNPRAKIAWKFLSISKIEVFIYGMYNQ